MRILLFKLLVIGASVLLWLTPTPSRGENPSAKSFYAYAIRYDIKNFLGTSTPVAYLDQIDISKDVVTKSTLIDGGYNSITVLDENHLILCNTEEKMIADGRGADIFDTTNNSFVTSLKIKGVKPFLTIATPDKIFVSSLKNRYEDTGKNGQKDIRIIPWASLEIFDLKTLKKIEDIDLRDNENIEERIALNKDLSRMYFIGWNPSFPGSAQGLIGIIDTGKNVILKQINYNNYFGGGRWIACVGNKLYVSAVDATSKEDQKPIEKRKLNDRLFVFDTETLSLSKTIPISVLAEQLTYVPSVNRLYIGHASWDERTPQYIEVLDCEKDKVIAKIPVNGFRRMSYVGNHKLYVSCSGGPLFGSNGGGCLVVIDVNTNKIIKRIPGEYAPISYNFDPHD